MSKAEVQLIMLKCLLRIRSLDFNVCDLYCPCHAQTVELHKELKTSALTVFSSAVNIDRDEFISL